MYTTVYIGHSVGSFYDSWLNVSMNFFIDCHINRYTERGKEYGIKGKSKGIHR